MSKNKKTYEDACESLSDFIFDSDIVERIFAHLPRTHFDVAVDDANERSNFADDLTNFVVAWAGRISSEDEDPLDSWT